jgi:hypothetical protein
LLVEGEQVNAVACERSRDAKVLYARTLDELLAWVATVRSGA